MSLSTWLDILFVRSLLAIYDYVFSTLSALVGSPGTALLLFGVVLNTGLMPLYRHMERVGRARAEGLRAMESEIARMKAHYRGRELHYYVRTIHRQFGYRPISVLTSSGALYLEIAVFLSVFRYLSTLWVFTGTPFLAIRDLSQPDQLLFGLNLLPFVMTALNAASALVYSPTVNARRTSLAIAALFAIVLYDSAAGLVLYWTSNNLFSLLRNVADRWVLPRLKRGSWPLFGGARER